MKVVPASGTERIELRYTGTLSANTAPTLYVNGSSSAVSVTIDTSTTGKVIITHSRSGRAVGDVLDYRSGSLTIDDTAYPMVIEPRLIDATVDSRLAPATAGRTINLNASGHTTPADGSLTYAKFGNGLAVSLGGVDGYGFRVAQFADPAMAGLYSYTGGNIDGTPFGTLLSRLDVAVSTRYSGSQATADVSQMGGLMGDIVGAISTMSTAVGGDLDELLAMTTGSGSERKFTSAALANIPSQPSNARPVTLKVQEVQVG